jgi:methionine-rich copper-binding protein CopC
MNILRSILILTLTLASISLAQAHAFLDHAAPRVGSSIHAAPAQVTIWMTEELEGAFSKLQVFDAKGTEVDKKDVKVSGAKMTVSVPTLAAGTYKVVWKAVATDTHKTSGTFNFTVQ